ncbi:hypothetical protein FCV25MIE_17587, partial [Fagus crenata]
SALPSRLLKIRPSRLHFRLFFKKTHLHKSISWPFHQTQPMGRSCLVLTAWVSRWRGQRHGSRGGGVDGVGLVVELGGGIDGGCVDFDLINNK